MSQWNIVSGKFVVGRGGWLIISTFFLQRFTLPFPAKPSRVFEKRSHFYFLPSSIFSFWLSVINRDRNTLSKRHQNTNIRGQIIITATNLIRLYPSQPDVTDMVTGFDKEVYNFTGGDQLGQVTKSTQMVSDWGFFPNNLNLTPTLLLTAPSFKLKNRNFSTTPAHQQIHIVLKMLKKKKKSILL